MSGGFVADGALSGAYELDLPDAACAVSARWVAVRLRGATNMLPVLIEVELDAVNYQDAVRFGITALPNAVAAATGGLPTVDGSNAVKLQSGTGANQISLASGLVTLAAVTHTGAVIPTVTTTTTATNLTNLPAVPTDWLTAAGVKADAVTKFQAGLSTYSGGAVASVTGNVGGNVVGSVASVTAGVTLAAVTHTGATIPTVTTVGTLTTYTGNTPQTGDAFARIGLTGSGLTSLATQVSVDAVDDLVDTEVAAIKADTAAIKLKTDNLPASPAAVGSAMVLSSTGLDAIATTYPAGVAATFPQMIVQLFYRFFGKATRTDTQIKTYAANGSTVVTTQAISDDGSVETQGAAT